MFSGGTADVGASGAVVQQRMEQLMELVDRGASMEEIHKAEAELADAMKQAPFEIKQQFTQANLGLIAVGYGCMGISRAYPDSLLQHSLNLPASQ